ncbi:MAG: hypothetical protein FJ404_01815 [Verrucomicrobia bacterium]|nr:hypothetical protein [Verrucomicrobiota bacterium]
MIKADGLLQAFLLGTVAWQRAGRGYTAGHAVDVLWSSPGPDHLSAAEFAMNFFFIRGAFAGYSPRPAILLVILFCGFSDLAAAEPERSLAPPLDPLKRLVGKTWRGEFKGGPGEKPIVDVVRWERILNGHAIRVVHSVNQGEYGGETTIVWNVKTLRLESYYFTTAGFFARGVLVMAKDKIMTTEEVMGHPRGITEVRTVMEFLPDGRIHLKARCLKNGEQSEGHEAEYVEAPGMGVVLR